MRGEILVVRTHHARGDNTVLGVIRGPWSDRRPSTVEISERVDYARYLFPVGSYLRSET